MSRIIISLLSVFLLGPAFSLLAQQDGTGKPAKAAGKAPRLVKPTVFLGHSEYKGGPIRKTRFDSLMRQGLTSHDSAGTKYRVVGFDFVYAERQLYEDSNAVLKVMVDLSTQYCTGDTLPDDMARGAKKSLVPTDIADEDPEETPNIYNRVKPGDTVYFEHVRVLNFPDKKSAPAPNAIPFLGKDLKCVIIK